MEQSEFEEMTSIGQYVEKGLISGYQIRQVSDRLFNIDNCVSVTEAVRSLVQERPLGDPTKECHVMFNDKDTVLDIVSAQQGERSHGPVDFTSP